MHEIDLMSIGSYTELPGGNIALPQGYSSLLTPIIQQIPDELILKQKPIKEIQWRYREEKEANEGYESDGSDCSVRTVKSVGEFWNIFFILWTFGTVGKKGARYGVEGNIHCLQKSSFPLVQKERMEEEGIAIPTSRGSHTTLCLPAVSAPGICEQQHPNDYEVVSAI